MRQNIKFVKKTLVWQENKAFLSKEKKDIPKWYITAPFTSSISRKTPGLGST